MSKFNYNDYQAMVEKAQNGTSSTKVGYFKLADDGDEALVRINCSNINDLSFASVHTVNVGGKWLKVNCLNPLGNYTDSCELCVAANNNNSTISKASKKLYIQMLVSYKDKVSGTWSAAQPVIWERPAAYSREIANKLRDYGDLTQVLLKVTRNGKAGDMKTTYSLDYAVPTIFKPEMVPADFSAFSNFNIAKHSYWEKTAEEIHTFLTTGAFPEVIKNEPSPVQSAPVITPVVNSNVPDTAVTVSSSSPIVVSQPTQTFVAQPTQVQPAQAQPTAETPTQTRNFNTSKFSF